MSRSPDEDRQLSSTVDGGLHRVPGPATPAVLSPTNRAGQPSTMWLHLKLRLSGLAQSDDHPGEARLLSRQSGGQNAADGSQTTIQP